MSPFDTPKIPHDLRLQWMQQTGFNLEELSSLYSTFNKIDIPILDMRFFCQLAVPEGRAAKNTDELRLRVKNSMHQQLQLLYSLMNCIYCDSYDPSKIALPKDSSAYVRSACVSSSLQAMTEAMCKTLYLQEEEEKPNALSNTASAGLDGDTDDDSDEDEESDFAPETQYLPTAYGIMDDYSGNGLVDPWQDSRVEELGEISVPDSSGRRGRQKMPLASPTPAIISRQLPSDASRTSIAETAPLQNSSSAPNPSEERSPHTFDGDGKMTVHSEPSDHDATETTPETPPSTTGIESSNTENRPEASSWPDLTPSHQASARTAGPLFQMEKCDFDNSTGKISPLAAAGRTGRQQNSLLNRKRRRSNEEEGEGRSTLLKRNRPK